MVFTENRSPLACERRTTIPILLNVKLSRQDGMLQLLASDLEISSQQSISAKFDSDWRDVTVCADALLRFVRTLSGETVRLTVGVNDRLTVASQGARATFGTLPVASFITVPEIGEPKSCEIEFSVLAAMIHGVQWAVGESKYTIPAARLNVGERTWMDGTNGKSASLVDGEAVKVDDGFSVLLSDRLLTVLGKSFVAGEVISIELGANLVRFSSGLSSITARPFKGAFPDIERVLPASPSRPYRGSAKALSSAITQVAQFAQSVNRMATQVIVIQVSDGRLYLAAKNQNTEYCSAEIECAGPDSGMIVVEPSLLAAAAEACGPDFQFGWSGLLMDLQAGKTRCIVMGMHPAGGEEGLMREAMAGQLEAVPA